MEKIRDVNNGAFAALSEMRRIEEDPGALFKGSKLGRQQGKSQMGNSVAVDLSGGDLAVMNKYLIGESMKFVAICKKSLPTKHSKRTEPTSLPAGLELNPYGPLSTSTIEKLEQWLQGGNDGDERDPIPWEVSREGRRVAQFGSARFDYDKQRVITASEAFIPPLPAILKSLPGVTSVYTQCIVNQYGPQEAIPWHTDDIRFGSNIMVFVLGENRPLLMRPAQDSKKRDSHVFYDAHGSSQTSQNGVLRVDISSLGDTTSGSYLMRGAARYEWQHSIGPGEARRTSITFRSLGSMNKSHPVPSAGTADGASLGTATGATAARMDEVDQGDIQDVVIVGRTNTHTSNAKKRRIGPLQDSVSAPAWYVRTRKPSLVWQFHPSLSWVPIKPTPIQYPLNFRT